ncbi:MAG TPA: glycosyltransferase family 2 protein [Saprospiraceae bacterium]|nr:glycosyltransferase family 2 protein [Saprospiraceae bacterium]
MEGDPEPKKLSVITVVFNGADTIETTIQSVVNPKHPDVEYIVVDGGSNDGTLEFIQDSGDLVDTWVSDRDKGLYDAMNKGMLLAKGEFIWFINSGDQIYDNQTIEKLIPSLNEETDIVYGEVMIIDNDKQPLGTRSELTVHKLPDVLIWQSMQYGMNVCHQGFIVRKKIAPLYRLDNLCADIEWVIECLKNSRKNVKLDFLFAKYLAGGLSKKKWQQSMIDRFLVLKKYFGLNKTIWSHFVIIFRALWHKLNNIGKQTY